MGPGIGELMATVAAQGIAPAGPWFTHHLRMDPNTFDFEIGVPVTAPVAAAAAGRVKPGQLPATTVARTVFQGAYEGLGAAWGEFDAWIVANGHRPGPELWEWSAMSRARSPAPTLTAGARSSTGRWCDANDSLPGARQAERWRHVGFPSPDAEAIIWGAGQVPPSRGRIS